MIAGGTILLYIYCEIVPGQKHIHKTISKPEHEGFNTRHKRTYVTTCTYNLLANLALQPFPLLVKLDTMLWDK